MAILICNHYESLELSIRGHFPILLSILPDLNNMYFIRLSSLLVILVLFSFGRVSSDLYLSVHRLEHLAKHEPFLLTGIKKYVDAQPLGVPAEIVRYVIVLRNRIITLQNSSNGIACIETIARKCTYMTIIY